MPVAAAIVAPPLRTSLMHSPPRGLCAKKKKPTRRSTHPSEGEREREKEQVGVPLSSIASQLLTFHALLPQATFRFFMHVCVRASAYSCLFGCACPIPRLLHILSLRLRVPFPFPSSWRSDGVEGANKTHLSSFREGIHVQHVLQSCTSKRCSHLVCHCDAAVAHLAACITLFHLVDALPFLFC